MATNPQLAQQVAAAISSSVTAKALAVQLLTAVGTDAPRWYDVGTPGGVLLLVRAGWGPLEDPRAFVELVPKGV